MGGGGKQSVEPKEEINLDTTNFGLWNISENGMSTFGVGEVLRISPRRLLDGRSTFPLYSTPGTYSLLSPLATLPLRSQNTGLKHNSLNFTSSSQ